MENSWSAERFRRTGTILAGGTWTYDVDCRSRIDGIQLRENVEKRCGLGRYCRICLWTGTGSDRITDIIRAGSRRNWADCRRSSGLDTCA